MGRCHFINGGGVKVVGEEEGADIAFASREAMARFVKVMFGKELEECDDAANVFRCTRYTLRTSHSWVASIREGYDTSVTFVNVSTFIDFVKKFLNMNVDPHIIKQTGKHVDDWFENSGFDVRYYPCFFDELNYLVNSN